MPEPILLETSADVELLLLPYIEDAPEERYGAVFLDEERVPLGVTTLCFGDALRVQFSIRKLIASALMHWEAPHVITWHNHIGASARPSEEDIEVFEALRGICEAVGIDLIDNVILSPGHEKKPFYSFQASGRFNT